MSFPPFIIPYIGGITNVKGDGHCGYRAVALQIYGDEESWGRVRSECYTEVRDHQELYERVLSWIPVSELLCKLAWYEPWVPEYYWMTLPEVGHIIATRYNVAFISYGSSGGNLCLPVTVRAGVQPPTDTVVLGQVPAHFIAV